ncbi:MAG: hypothetical protein IPK19_39450 [Chloroflexi bacterium]|nr:hypothetical protein [Chloroflexota bacterium]
MTITAETEEGWVAATATTPASLRVELDRTQPAECYLKFAEGSDGSTIQGLSITAPYMGIYLRSDNNWMAGNHLGVSPDGLTERGNSDSGVQIWSAGSGGNLIGGSAPVDRNVISGNLIRVSIFGSKQCRSGELHWHRCHRPAAHPKRLEGHRAV